MATIKLLYNSEYKVNEKIILRIPTVREVLENEEDYYGLVSLITAMPIDMMVQLDDIGIDFRKINEFELFVLMFGAIDPNSAKLIFKDLDVTKFKLAKNQDNDQIVLLDEENDITIDRLIHTKIAQVLRTIHGLKRNHRKPGNEDAYKYMLERARAKLKRVKTSSSSSQLETLIVGLVNTSEFKYDYETVQDLTIYQFNKSVSQVIHKIEYDNRMTGIYTGNLDATKLSQDDLVWLQSNNI